MVIPAIQFFRGIGINVSMSRRHAERKGNCLFDSVVLIENPDFSEVDRRLFRQDMRSLSVGEALRQIDHLGEERLERLRLVMTNKKGGPQTKEKMKQF